MKPISFAFLAAGSFGLWTVFHKLASPFVNPILGAILVSATAVLFGMIYFFLQVKDTSKLISDPKGIIFILLAGVSAFFIDYLALQAYSKGLPLTVGGPIIIGGSMAVAISIGFLLGEPFSIAKLIGIALVIAGSIVLAAYSS